MFKGLKKVFKRVFSVVKKLILPAIVVGALVMTAGAASGAAPLLGAGGALGGGAAGTAAAGAGGGGSGILGAVGRFLFGGGGAAAGATGAAATGAAATGTAVAGATGGGGGLFGMLGRLFSSPVGGNILKGIGGQIVAWNERRAGEEAEERDRAAYNGAGRAMEWNDAPNYTGEPGGAGGPAARGLGAALEEPTFQPRTEMREMAQRDPLSDLRRAPRLGLAQGGSAAPTPRYRFDPSLNRIVMA